jgi:hypothetical protein
MICFLFLFFFVYIYRREVFADENVNIPVSQTAQNVPVDRIDSPYSFNIEEDRSTIEGRNRFMNKEKKEELV